MIAVSESNSSISGDRYKWFTSLLVAFYIGPVIGVGDVVVLGCCPSVSFFIDSFVERVNVVTSFVPEVVKIGISPV